MDYYDLAVSSSMENYMVLKGLMTFQRIFNLRLDTAVYLTVSKESSESYKDACRWMVLHVIPVKGNQLILY